ncbi:RNA methyltransferase [Thermogladius sp. 4427co]|uniref:RNA methyltransferase n=1 Tax=Thermogladius sp. 4427co TaxID=3450718 RepID=UPI003F78FC3D
MIVRVVLVGVEGAFNLGVVARTCMNFGVEELYLVNPRADLNEALNYAARAREYLSKAVIVDDLKKALEGVDLSASTSDEGFARGDPLRQALPLGDFVEMVKSKGFNRVAIVFGRESTGLTREEIASTDILVTIPASPTYPALNLAQAVAIVLWELWKARSTQPANIPPAASRESLEKLAEAFDSLVDKAISPEDKRKRIKTVARRVVFKSNLSDLEAKILLYLVKKIERKLEGKGSGSVKQ